MTQIEPLPPLVSTEWLAARLGCPNLRVVDGSWYLPSSRRNPASEYMAGHIPGAVFFDLDRSSEPMTPLPHMLPSADAFAQRMSALGLRDEDDVVVYDGSGKNLSAPRVWWMFRIFGHPRVAVLDGGFGKWQREGRPIESGLTQLPRGRFTAQLDHAAVRDLAAMQANLLNRAEQVVDTRSAGRFTGAEPEPRPGLRGGHIPGAVNVPFDNLVDADGMVLPLPELRRRLETAGVDPSRPIVASCGSGVSACALVFSLYLLGQQQVAVYDGAWTEWGGRGDTPVDTGDANQ